MKWKFVRAVWCCGVVLMSVIPLAQAKERVWYCTTIDAAGFQHDEGGPTTAMVFRASGRYVIKQSGERLILSMDIMGPLRYECVEGLGTITCTSLYRFFGLNTKTGFALWLEEKGGWLHHSPFRGFTALNRLKCETF